MLDIKVVKERERAYREKDVPFGVWTVQTKTKWWNKVELYNVLQGLKGHKGKYLLDVGCSDGRFLEYCHKKFPDWKLFGIDFAVKPLTVLFKKDFPKTVICGDSCEIPIKSSTFDCVVSIQVSHQIPSRLERVNCLKEIQFILRQGGTFIITVLNQKTWHEMIENGKEGNFVNNPNLYAYLYDPDDFTVELEEAGFVVKKIIGINNLPVRYLKRLGLIGVWMDLVITKYFRSLSLRKSCYLLAACQKR